MSMFCCVLVITAVDIERIVRSAEINECIPGFIILHIISHKINSIYFASAMVHA